MKSLVSVWTDLVCSVHGSHALSSRGSLSCAQSALNHFQRLFKMPAPISAQSATARPIPFGAHANTPKYATSHPVHVHDHRRRRSPFGIACIHPADHIIRATKTKRHVQTGAQRGSITLTPWSAFRLRLLSIPFAKPDDTTLTASKFAHADFVIMTPRRVRALVAQHALVSIRADLACKKTASFSMSR